MTHHVINNHKRRLCLGRKLTSADQQLKVKLGSCNNQCPKEVSAHTHIAHVLLWRSEQAPRCIMGLVYQGFEVCV